MLTFLPYRLRSSARMVTNFSPQTEKPPAKAWSLDVKAVIRELISSWESFIETTNNVSDCIEVRDPTPHEEK